MTQTIPTITVDMDKKCVECGKPGAVGSGICLSCVAKALSGKPMRSMAGLDVQRNFQAMKNRARRD